MTGTEQQLPAVHFLGLVGPLACRSRVSVPLMLATPFRQQSNVTTAGTNYCLLGGIKQWWQREPIRIDEELNHQVEFELLRSYWFHPYVWLSHRSRGHFSPASWQLRSPLCKCFLTSLSRLQRDVWEFEVCGWLHSTEWLGWWEHARSFLSVSLVRWCQPHVWGIQRLLIDCSLHMNTNKSRGPQLQHKHLLNVFCHNYMWIGNVHAVFLWNRTHLCFEGWDQLLENRDRIRETFWLKTSQQYLSFMMS